MQGSVPAPPLRQGFESRLGQKLERRLHSFYKCKFQNTSVAIEVQRQFDYHGPRVQVHSMPCSQRSWKCALSFNFGKLTASILTFSQRFRALNFYFSGASALKDFKNVSALNSFISVNRSLRYFLKQRCPSMTVHCTLYSIPVPLLRSRAIFPWLRLQNFFLPLAALGKKYWHRLPS